MTGYGIGDAEPEDAWHPDDPTPVLLDNVARRLVLLGEPVAAELGELAGAVQRLELNRPMLTLAERVRLDLAAADVVFLERRAGYG